MLGEIVGFVGGSWIPVNNKVSLFNVFADPIEAHVDGFRSDMFAGFVEDGGSGCIIGFDGRCSLLVTPFFRGLFAAIRLLCSWRRGLQPQLLLRKTYRA